MLFKKPNKWFYLALVLAASFLSYYLVSNQVFSPYFKLDANLAVDLFLLSEGKTLAKKFGLRHRYDEAEMFGGDVEMLGIVFDTQKNMDKTQVRKLIDEMQKDLTKAINNSKSLSSFLKIKPFTYANVEITIFFFDEQGRERLYPSFCVISFLKGNFRYYYDKTYEESGYSLVEVESYEEATMLLEGNSKKVGNMREQEKSDVI